MRVMAWSLAAGLAFGVATDASAAVSVFGGSGYAHACSLAAQDGSDDEADERTCSMALELELLSPLDRAGTLVNRGIVKLRRQAFDAAIADFDLALRTKPDLGEAFVNRGAALVGAKRYAEAVATLNRALEVGAPEPHKAYYNRGLAYEMLDDVVAAQLDFKKALELEPDWGLPRRQLARYGIAP